jgi:hypothetical protein
MDRGGRRVAAIFPSSRRFTGGVPVVITRATPNKTTRINVDLVFPQGLTALGHIRTNRRFVS